MTILVQSGSIQKVGVVVWFDDDRDPQDDLLTTYGRFPFLPEVHTVSKMLVL